MTLRFLAILTILVSASACSVRSGNRGNFNTDGGGGGSDGGGLQLDDAGRTADGALPPVNECNPSCGDMELCGAMNDGNGLDDDCNGMVDEGCICVTGTTRPCFTGPPDRRNRGACADGIQTCGEFLDWLGCVGDTAPSAETCDGVDNDCNGANQATQHCELQLGRHLPSRRSVAR